VNRRDRDGNELFRFVAERRNLGRLRYSCLEQEFKPK
jgi:hypothetical protein